MKKYIPLLLMLFIIGCSYGKDASKEVSGEIGDSFQKANEKQSLLESREKVIKSKNRYNSCLKDNPSRCESEKEKYEDNVAEYVELQKKLSDL